MPRSILAHNHTLSLTFSPFEFQGQALKRVRWPKLRYPRRTHRSSSSDFVEPLEELALFARVRAPGQVPKALRRWMVEILCPYPAKVALL